MLRAREDARLAVEELRREPAAAIFARAHAGPRATEDEALFRTVLLGLLISTAEACGGFDWDDEAFERRTRSSRRSLFGEHRRYVGGRSAHRSLAREAGRARTGLVVRPFVAGELATHWPESRGLLPAGLRARARSHLSSSSCGSELDAGAAPPDAAAEIADAVSALRLTTIGRASPPGPCCSRRSTVARSGSSRCCRSRRRSLPASRLGSTPSGRRSRSTSSLLSATPTAIPSSRMRSTAGSSRSSRPSRFGASSSVRRSPSLLGETWPMRCCVLLAEERGRGRSSTGARPRWLPARPRVRPRRTRRGVPSSLCCARAIATGSSTSSTASCSGSTARRRHAHRRLTHDSARSRYPSASGARATVDAWTSRGPCSSDSSGSRRSTGRRARRASSSTSCARSWSRRRRGRRREGGDARSAGRRASLRVARSQRDMIAV